MAHSAKVLDIAHLKSTSKLRHKQLGVSVQLPDTSTVVVYMKGDCDWAPLNATSSINLTLDGPSFTNNCIYISQNGDKDLFQPDLCWDIKTCCTLTLLEDNPLTLANFVVLLPAVTAFAPLYDPLKHQCYWYVLVIYKAVFTKYPQSQECVEATAIGEENILWTQISLLRS
jgi:hypothetical protein